MASKSLFRTGILILLLTSCLPEKKLARDFLNDRPQFNLMILVPEMVYKYNHRGEEIAGLSDLGEAQQDSALFVNSRYIQFVSDSIFLERYVNQFTDELRQLGLNVYLANAMDTFLRSEPQSYLLNMAQLQLDEYSYPYEDRYPADDSVYYKVFPLNAVDFSTWFELGKLNATGSDKLVLYSTHTVMDDFDGYFYMEPFSMELRYRYRLDTLEVDRVYAMASAIGKRHADYLFDFFLNQFVMFHLTPSSFAPYYYHYDRSKDALIPTEDERFEILQ